MERPDRLMALVLALAAALLALLVAALATGDGRDVATPHPAHAPMQRGLDAGTLGAPLWAGYAAGLLIMGLMGLALAIGFPRPRWMRRAALVFTVYYAAVFVALMRAYRAYAAGDSTVFGGFTEPAAWLVYAIGLVPWLFLLAVMWGFDRVCFGTRERARFEEILAGGAGEDPRRRDR